MATEMTKNKNQDIIYSFLNIKSQPDINSMFTVIMLNGSKSSMYYRV